MLPPFFLPFGFHELKITFPKFPPNFAPALLSQATQLMALTSLRMTLSRPMLLSLHGDSVASE